jgi:hypothetical protein
MSLDQNHLEMMMENMTFGPTGTEASVLPLIRLQMNRYGILFIIIFGNIGSLFSIVIYRRPNFSASTCTTYLLAVSINTFLFVNFALLTRLLEVAFDSINFTSTSLAFCRIRSLFYHAISHVLSRSCLFRSLSGHSNDILSEKNIIYFLSFTSCVMFVVLCSYTQIFYY